MTDRIGPFKITRANRRLITAVSAVFIMIYILYVARTTLGPPSANSATDAGSSIAAVNVTQSSNPIGIPIPVSAKGCLANNGLAYSPFRDGQAPSDPSRTAAPFPTRAQIDEDLDFISKITKNVRTYASSDKYAHISLSAKNHGLKVMQGIYLGPDRKANDAEIDAAVELAHQGLVDSIVVGNETLSASGYSTRMESRLTKQDLISYIREVKKKLAPAKVPVSTAQIYSDWNSNLDLGMEVDFVVAHFYPFWEGKPVASAAAAVFEEYSQLETAFQRKLGRDLRIVIGETGWPSNGTPHGDGVPSPENQRKFVEEFITLACKDSIPFYYFEAFDEEWKWREGDPKWEGNSILPEGDRTFSGRWTGSSWGIFSSAGRLKSQLAGLLDQPPIGSRANRDIFVDPPGLLSAYYDIGVDCSPAGNHDWLTVSNEELEMSYPDKQQWGAVFVTVGKPTSPPRPWKDFSEFEAISMEMRGKHGGESVGVGVMTRTDPANGNETRIVETLTKDYRRYTFPLRDFRSGHLRIPDGLKQLYVIVECVFQGPKYMTVYAKNIRYETNRKE